MKYENKEAFEQVNMFGTGTPNTAYSKFFIGDAFLNPLTDPKGSLFAANVTFEPACRNNWHIHHATSGGGQLLLCTAGEGWYQEAGKAAQSLAPAVQMSICPPPLRAWWMCQLLRQPGSKVTFARNTGHLPASVRGFR